MYKCHTMLTINAYRSILYKHRLNTNFTTISNDNLKKQNLKDISLKSSSNSSKLN
jgi:hypothetical protein